ncbi:MAG: DoxX family protein [Candidatus Omnitrophica bacterium]|nr:DoxX family protein [Candidatus Omnitrophota bacterium]MDE2222136.1 DoxX family protein [Candidatus Omnitrophota bacterium]
MTDFLLKNSTAPASTVFVRCITGYVFFVEGVQKYLFPDTLGVGRFIKIGIPWPHVMVHFSAGAEIICGLLLIAGLFTRLAAIPLIINISVAILSTKVPMFLHKGFWPAVHESRLDFAMLMCLIFLLLEGAGRLSADARLLPAKE